MQLRLYHYLGTHVCTHAYARVYAHVYTDVYGTCPYKRPYTSLCPHGMSMQRVHATCFQNDALDRGRMRGCMRARVGLVRDLCGLV